MLKTRAVLLADVRNAILILGNRGHNHEQTF